MTGPAIETFLDGHRFRSRLEARWHIFFKTLGVKALYEHQGFVVAGRPYLPDFYLPATQTWVEVKGPEHDLDHDLMESAACELPSDGDPVLLILGPVPEPPEGGDWAWLGFSRDEGIAEPLDGWWGFGSGTLRHSSETSSATAYSNGGDWLTPALDMRPSLTKAVAAYAAARSARFEHGENGAPR
jgi:hypothetical protein